jgi:hypothetical protein
LIEDFDTFRDQGGVELLENIEVLFRVRERGHHLV